MRIYQIHYSGLNNEHRTIWGWKSDYLIMLMSAKLYEDIVYHGGIQAITLLGNRPSFTKLWHLEILTLESMGKPKMWNILKTADRRVKRMKIWDSGYYSAHMEVTVDAQFLEFGLG